MQYTKEVEDMVCVAKGPNHGPAPIPEEGKWIQAKEIRDISAYTHGVGWCAPQQGACKLSLNVKEGINQLLKKENLSQGVSVQEDNGKLLMEFHVIVAYGVSISAVSDNLIENVKYKVEAFTGIPVEKVNVFVEGVRLID